MFDTNKCRVHSVNMLMHRFRRAFPDFHLILTESSGKSKYLHFGLIGNDGVRVKAWAMAAGGKQIDICGHFKHILLCKLFFVEIMELGGSNECFGCGRTGHWLKDCPNGNASRARCSRARGRGRGAGAPP